MKADYTTDTSDLHSRDTYKQSSLDNPILHSLVGCNANTLAHRSYGNRNQDSLDNHMVPESTMDNILCCSCDIHILNTPNNRHRLVDYNANTIYPHSFETHSRGNLGTNHRETARTTNNNSHDNLDTYILGNFHTHLLRLRHMEVDYTTNTLAFHNYDTNTLDNHHKVNILVDDNANTISPHNFETHSRGSLGTNYRATARTTNNNSHHNLDTYNMDNPSNPTRRHMEEDCKTYSMIYHNCDSHSRDSLDSHTDLDSTINNIPYHNYDTYILRSHHKVNMLADCTTNSMTHRNYDTYKVDSFDTPNHHMLADHNPSNTSHNARHTNMADYNHCNLAPRIQPLHTEQ